jgi:hypothetical protein
MKVYDGASWITATSAGATSLIRFRYVATAGQTTFSGADSASATLTYTVNNIVVFLNGVALDSTDYTASNGTSIVLGTGAALNDELVVIAFKSFTVADALSAVSGGTVNGSVTITGALTANGNVILGDASTDTLNVGNGGLIKDASGNLGVGVTPTNNTLGKTLQVGQAGALVAESGTNRWWLANNWYYNSGDKYINNGFATLYSQQNGTHQWQTAASGTQGNPINFTQAMTLDASGGLKVLNTIGVGNATPSTSGAGITFPAGQSASSNANTLDDYEEGTWVVTFTAATSGTITLNSSNNELSYIKIGSQVTIFGRVLISSVSSPVGSIQINLPFVPEQGLADQSDFYALPVMTHDVDLSAGAVTVFAESSNANYLVVYQTIDNAAWVALPAANLKGNGNEYFYITGSYRAA